MSDDNIGDKLSCCNEGDCCSQGKSANSRTGIPWKTLIFSATIVLAGAVAAYSLFWNDSSAAAPSCCPPGSAAACGITTTVPGFDHTQADTGLSFYVFLNDGDALSQQDLAVISEVRTVLETQGAQLDVETFRSGEPAFEKLAAQYEIAALPAVLVVGQDRSLLFKGGNIARDTVLSLYKRNSPAEAASTSPECQPK